MEKLDNIIQFYKQLALTTSSSPDEVRSLKSKLGPQFCWGESSNAKEESSTRKRKRQVEYLSRLTELERNVDDLVKESKELIDRGGFHYGITLDAPDEIAVELPVAELVGQQFESNLNEILGYLEGNDVSTIGVLGMGGVGKTTLVKHVHNHVKKRSPGIVRWITVSKECGVQRLQSEIAKSVGQDLSNEDDLFKRAGMLAHELKRKDKFVLILDDIWQDFDENDVGLPKLKGHKLILTTRSEQVCSKMACDKVIKVGHLSKEEAWNLFVKYIGYEIPSHLTESASDVCKECAGLPLGIITLARSMRKKFEVYEWRNVLIKLKNSKLDVEDMEPKVFRVLRLSYEFLNDPKLQQCLLYCTTYPEDSIIKEDELIWGFIDMGIFNQIESIQEMLDEAKITLKKLVRACLLSEYGRHFWMHDLIRDMALQIAGYRFMVKTRIGLKEFPNKRMWSDDLEVVSLGSNEFKEIPDISPKCQRLSMLLLQKNPFKSVPECFFEYMDGLKVLNLSETNIKILPKSISRLKNLTALILRFCYVLERIPSLAELDHLERLDLWNTRYVRELPEGLKELVKLMDLNLQKTNLVVPLEALPRSSNLQYLKVDVLRVSGNDSTDHLKGLETFEGQFHDIDNFNAYVRHMKKMQRRPKEYMIRVGLDPDSETWYIDYEPKNVYIDGGKIHGGRERGSSVELPSDTRSLDVLRYDMWSLFDELSTPLDSLEYLRLDSLQELRSLFGASLPVSDCFFPQLKELRIDFCSKIKKLFSLRMLSDLPNLEHIRVKHCKQLEEVIEAQFDGDGKVANTAGVALPKLRKLILWTLPKLRSVVSESVGVIGCPSFKELFVYRCPKLRRMTLSLPLATHVQPSSNSSLPKIKLGKGEEKWWELLEWDPPNTKTILQPSFSCNRFRNVDKF